MRNESDEILVSFMSVGALLMALRGCLFTDDRCSMSLLIECWSQQRVERGKITILLCVIVSFIMVTECRSFDADYASWLIVNDGQSLCYTWNVVKKVV